jgi:hypothetical protein
MLIVVFFFFLVCFEKKKTTTMTLAIVFFFFWFCSIHPHQKKHWLIFNPKSIAFVNAHHFDYIKKFEKK